MPFEETRREQSQTVAAIGYSEGGRPFEDPDAKAVRDYMMTVAATQSPMTHSKYR